MKFIEESPRFSFCLDGTEAFSLPHKTRATRTGDTATTEYRFSDGLKVTNFLQIYKDFGAYEWVNHWENTADTPTGKITELWDADVVVPLPAEETGKWCAFLPSEEEMTTLSAPNGSLWQTKEFYCDTDRMEGGNFPNRIRPGETREFRASGGRSSEERAPFFRVDKGGTGYMFAVGWTGQWLCRMERSTDSLHFRSKVEDTAFRLLPGESVRTSSVLIMPYRDGKTQAHNRWRRLLKEHFSLLGKHGRPDTAPLCACVWGGMRTSAVLERIDLIRKNHLPYDCLWMDAGWYGDTDPTPDEFEGNWYEYVGDWRVSTKVHPDGLREVSRAAHEAGMKFLLWFEPERVVAGVPATIEHPEYFLPSATPGEERLRLLDLGNPSAWQYVLDTLSTMINDLGIDVYRQDFNMAPLATWRAADAEDRRGMTEIRHINGLYRLWDALLTRFPHLLIDNCASGGRRLDIETLRRSVPLWRSDFTCSANYPTVGVQCHGLTYPLWMPYSGTGAGRIADEYRIRSSYAPGLTLNNCMYSERMSLTEAEKYAPFLRRYTEEYLRVRPYLSCDFYPLTEVSDAGDVWCAVQYDRPEKGDGVLLVFCREKSPYLTARFSLRGLSADASYALTDADGGVTYHAGSDLCAGWEVTVGERPKAKIFFYKKENM